MRLLVLLSRFPYPLEKGDKLRAYHQIRQLATQHEVYLVALSDYAVPDEDVQQLAPYCQAVFPIQNDAVRRCFNIGRAFFKGLPLQCGFFYSGKIQKRIDRIIEEVQPDWLYCQLFRMAEYVKDKPIPKVLDYQDVFSKGMWRRHERAPWYQKPFFKMEAQRVARYEAEIFDKFDYKTIITEVDRNLIPHDRRQEILVVPNGVDFGTFTQQQQEKNYDLIFSGNMNYAPNVDAAEYLCQDIFPHLRMEFPNLRIVLCGANPSPRVKALENEHVKVTGWVDSMAEWYAQSRIFIAPMRMGTGLQNKLLEAMAMQLPCVTSTLAGKPLVGADKEKAFIICNTTADYVNAIRHLLQDLQHYQTLATQGNQYVHQHYDWPSATQPLMDILH
ncbi:MAG: glycosyltransferase [Bacteroidales bacterium]|nr:glycosyltransferase [Bacteroidales bacterium]